MLQIDTRWNKLAESKALHKKLFVKISSSKKVKMTQMATADAFE